MTTADETENEPGGLLAPSAWITRFAPLVPPGSEVLDLACGSGRHSRLFADRGCRVVALDIDITRLGDLSRHPLIEAVAADLEKGKPWPLKGRRFDAVVVANYLHRPLMPGLAAALAPAGLLLYETFARGNEQHGKPSNPDHLLQHGELLRFAAEQELFVLAYEDLEETAPRPACRQRLAARQLPA